MDRVVNTLPKPGPFYPVDESKRRTSCYVCPGAPIKSRGTYVRPPGIESVVRELFPSMFIDK